MVKYVQSPQVGPRSQDSHLEEPGRIAEEGDWAGAFVGAEFGRL